MVDGCQDQTDIIAAQIIFDLATLTDLQDFVNNATNNECQQLTS